MTMRALEVADELATSQIAAAVLHVATIKPLDVETIVAECRREGRLVVIENLSIEAPKTKLLSQKLQGMGLESVLVITDTIEENLLLASRNLPNVLVVEPKAADPMSLVFYKKVLVTKAALAKIEEMYA